MIDHLTNAAQLDERCDTPHGTAAPPVLLIGGTGKTGRRVAERLARHGVAARPVSRSTSPAFDWHDPASWTAAVDGVERAYVTFHPDLAFPGALELVEAFSARAVDAGVTRLVLLSGRGEPAAQAAEDVIATSGAAWTVVRASWFAQNFSEHFLLPHVLQRAIRLPVGDIGEPFIDVDDIADVATAALVDDGHDNKVYEVTGPRLLTFADVADELTTAIGTTVRFEPVSVAAFRSEALSAGLDTADVDALVALFTEILDGRNAHTTSGVNEALGRAPHDFADFARNAAATGVWGAP